MKNIFILLLISIAAVACNKEEVAKGTPKCIENKIADIAKGDVWNPPAKVYSYLYNEETVYYIPARCCDIPSTLYDENCDIVCSPDGGLTGGGDGQCTDFFDTRTEEKLIWEDVR